MTVVGCYGAGVGYAGMTSDSAIAEAAKTIAELDHYYYSKQYTTYDDAV